MKNEPQLKKNSNGLLLSMSFKISMALVLTIIIGVITIMVLIETQNTTSLNNTTLKVNNIKSDVSQIYTPKKIVSTPSKGTMMPIELKNKDETVLPQKKIAVEIKDTIKYWTAPNIASLSKNHDKDLILYGKDLIVHTSKYFGENGKIAKKATNGMNCQNCHLSAGTKVFGNNYGAVASTYPKYRARSGTIEDVSKRVNDCFERSLNGKTLDLNSREMQGIIAYINWLGKDVPHGLKPIGTGFKDLELLHRAASIERGKDIYGSKCISCHQLNGDGVRNLKDKNFIYPPLWGDKSYNDGAGLYRISNFAKFVKYNMPFGVTHNSPQLKDEEAWDVAAFVNSQPRPKKRMTEDWPKIEEKPFDYPFGPYIDSFNEIQHKYGPFKPIQDQIKELKKITQK
jgi:thiosulfate dehydrogenase